MRKITYVSLALTVTPLLFVGCVQEKVSRIIPSKSKGNYVQAVASSNIEGSVKAKDNSNQIISESELDKLVTLVQEKLASEPKQEPKLSKRPNKQPQIFQLPPLSSISDTTTIATNELSTDEILFEETDMENMQPEETAIFYDSGEELEELTKLVENSLDGEIHGIEGVYSTPIVLNEEGVDIEEQPILQNPLESIKEAQAQKEKELLRKENEIISTAIAFLDTEYIWAANGPTAFDCSGFTKYVYKEHGVTIPRYSGNQAKVGEKIQYEDLKIGDLVFFDTEKKYKKKVNHVGIYMGDNKFIHASSAKKKVVITSFKKKHFYKKRFLWGQRIIKEEPVLASL